MLPTEDALWVGEDLQRRFGLPYWQFTLTATNANRFAIRIAREITQRKKILVFHYCYHGTVDESFATLENGVVGPPPRQYRPARQSRRNHPRRRVQRSQRPRRRPKASRCRLHSRRTRHDQRRHHSS